VEWGAALEDFDEGLDALEEVVEFNLFIPPVARAAARRGGIVQTNVDAEIANFAEVEIFSKASVGPVGTT